MDTSTDIVAATAQIDLLSAAATKLKSQLADMEARLAEIEREKQEWVIFVRRSEALKRMLAANVNGVLPGVMPSDPVELMPNPIPAVARGTIVQIAADAMRTAPGKEMRATELVPILLAEKPELGRAKNLRSMVYTALARRKTLFKKVSPGVYRLKRDDYTVVDRTADSDSE